MVYDIIAWFLSVFVGLLVSQSEGAVQGRRTEAYMNCNWPNCRLPALWTPVIEVPTVRTVGLIKPQLSPLLRQGRTMAKFKLNPHRIVAQYEALMRSYNLDLDKMVNTDQPTYLIGREVCNDHKTTYNILDWIRAADWIVLREAAQHYGYDLPPAGLVRVKFQPLGWKPHNGSLELARDRMAKED